MFVATMDTEHYHWTALGATEEEARYALSSGFLRHLEALGAEWDKDDSPEDWYGVNVLEVQPGQCFRDYTEV